MDQSRLHRCRSIERQDKCQHKPFNYKQINATPNRSASSTRAQTYLAHRLANNTYTPQTPTMQRHFLPERRSMLTLSPNVATDSADDREDSPVNNSVLSLFNSLNEL